MSGSGGTEPWGWLQPPTGTIFVLFSLAKRVLLIHLTFPGDCGSGKRDGGKGFKADVGEGH